MYLKHQISQICLNQLAKGQGRNLQDLQDSEALLGHLLVHQQSSMQKVNVQVHTLGKDELLVNSQGNSYISYADYAIAIVDEAENVAHINERFTVVGEQV